MINLQIINEREIYIYGAGDYATVCFRFLNKKGIDIKAFVVSDTEEIRSDADKLKDVLHLRDLKNVKSANIIVAVGNKHWNKIRENIKNFTDGNNCFYNITYISESDIMEMRRIIEPFDPNDFLDRSMPSGSFMGCDRGTSISRYYIQKFLDSETERVNVNVTNTYEVGESRYSDIYFPNAKHGILDFSKGVNLTKKVTLPCECNDIFICTQVFNFIYDIKNAIEGAYYVLKDNGILLATVAGNISQVSRSDMKNYGDFWRFTYLSAQRAFGEIFGEDNITVTPFGNAMSTTAYIQGLCVEDLPHPELLDISDPEYALLIGITAVKVKK